MVHKGFYHPNNNNPAILTPPNLKMKADSVCLCNNFHIIQMYFVGYNYFAIFIRLLTLECRVEHLVFSQSGVSEQWLGDTVTLN